MLVVEVERLQPRYCTSSFVAATGTVPAAVGAVFIRKDGRGLLHGDVLDVRDERDHVAALLRAEAVEAFALGDDECPVAAAAAGARAAHGLAGLLKGEAQ